MKPLVSGLHEIRSSGAYRCIELWRSDLLSARSDVGLTCAVMSVDSLRATVELRSGSHGVVAGECTVVFPDGPCTACHFVGESGGGFVVAGALIQIQSPSL